MGHIDKGVRNYNPSWTAQNTKEGKAYMKAIHAMEPYERFLYTIKERHKVHCDRFPEGYTVDEHGNNDCVETEKPWTDDPILQNVFYCNPYNRQNDRVSRWLLDNWVIPYRDEPCVLLGTIYLRWYNYIPTMRKLIDAGIPQALSNLKKGTKAIQESVDVLVELRDEYKEQLFGGAYIIRPIVDGEKGARKVESIGQLMVRMLEDRQLYPDIIGEGSDREPILPPKRYLALGSTLTDGIGGSMNYAFARLQQFSGMGKFYCYQFIGDLSFSHVFDNAPDWWTWSFVGPGTARGLYRLRCENGKAQLPDGDRLPRQMRYDREMAQELLDLQKRVNKDLGVPLIHTVKRKPKAGVKDPAELTAHARSGKEIQELVPFSMINLTNALCEYDKYDRAMYNERSIKRPYRGT